eukprot:SAG31_NODE_43375_length_267_cov_0.904762_1_plen_20_part_10
MGLSGDGVGGIGGVCRALGP